MLGRLACALGFHRVVTTREGSEKRPVGGSKATVQGAAQFIHALCYREGCEFHVIIDTHSGRKDIVTPAAK